MYKVLAFIFISPSKCKNLVGYNLSHHSSTYFSEYESSKLGVMNFTASFAESLASEIPKSGPRIQEIFEQKSFKSESEQKLLVDWITTLYYPKFNVKIGFTGDTVDLWPAVNEARTIMRKLEIIAPGLTQKIDTKGNIEKHEVIQRLIKKFENDKVSRKIELKIKTGNLYNLSQISTVSCIFYPEDFTKETL